MLRYLPNTLTICRLLLAVPLGIMILRTEYNQALAIGLLAGATDLLDGFLARRLNAFSRFGAALDPVADKVLITVTLVCCAQVGLIPWYVALTIVARDLIIVGGAICYHFLIGPFEFAATRLGKINMAIHIAFCFLVLGAQVFGSVPSQLMLAATITVLAAAVTSGLDYVVSWSLKALRNRESGS